MIILLHSSKTMRTTSHSAQMTTPLLFEKAEELVKYIRTLSIEELASVMKISTPIAEKTYQMYDKWSSEKNKQNIAIDSFVGDIYSGLHANDLSAADREYANKTLRILSGLYGIIRPFDGISPYRLEMAYRLPEPPYTNLYEFWGREIAKCIPNEGIIANLAAVEYSKTITPFVDSARVIGPHFLTVDPDTGEPTFVVVHAKIARGAFARWLITEKIEKATDFTEFSDLGYTYSKKLSEPQKPTFVCQEFAGIGRSIRPLKEKPNR